MNTSIVSGVERLREQDTRPLLRDRINSSACNRRQQATCGDTGGRHPHRAVQTRVSVNLRLGDTRPSTVRGTL